TVQTQRNCDAAQAQQQAVAPRPGTRSDRHFSGPRVLCRQQQTDAQNVVAEGVGPQQKMIAAELDYARMLDQRMKKYRNKWLPGSRRVRKSC
ncbi:unnamed protein product, partial [Amoebophrya sp. A25]